MTNCTAMPRRPQASANLSVRPNPEAPPEVELEALLYLLRELPHDCPEYGRMEARVAALVRPYLVRVARTVAREWGVSPQDLVQEGLLAVLLRQCRQPFDPGRAGAGRSAFPAHAMKLGRQAIVLAATQARCPVHLTDHAREALRRAKRAAREAQTSVADALSTQGLEAATAHALGDGTIHTTLPVVQSRAMAALHALPHLQRLGVSAVVGVGQPGGKATTERTVAQQLHLSQATVRALREKGLRRLRELLTGPTPAVARTGAVRRPRASLARDVRPVCPGLPQLELGLGDTGA